ncbi:hypothetical protein MTO96_028697 [Rhipicephalus appendiculatus]
MKYERCDYVDDCGDNSDEMDCGGPPTQLQLRELFLRLDTSGTYGKIKANLEARAANPIPFAITNEGPYDWNTRRSVHGNEIP